MKYVIVLGDGMADLPFDGLNNKTPLEVANKPNIDSAAKRGILGMARTVYPTLSPGSDVANLCVLGYNPLENYSGRSPLEAASIGVMLSDEDITYRSNLVTLSDNGAYSKKVMTDYSSGEITTEEAAELINAVKMELENDDFNFYSGTSYRHLLVRKNRIKAGNLTPPHDISDKVIEEYLPADKDILDIMEKSYEILKDHPINQDRIKRGLNPANSLWIWGEGTKPKLDNFYEKFNKRGAVISAVDLLKGIAILTGMEVINVEGATGNIHTNFKGKAESSINALKNGIDFLYVHIEAADESGHQGCATDKVKSIEYIDELVFKPIYEYLKESKEEFRILVMPDHPTPLKLKTHTMDPVPFLLIKDTDSIVKDENAVYTENYANNCGLIIEEGHTLIKRIFNDEI